MFEIRDMSNARLLSMECSDQDRLLELTRRMCERHEDPDELLAKLSLPTEEADYYKEPFKAWNRGSTATTIKCIDQLIKGFRESAYLRDVLVKVSSTQIFFCSPVTALTPGVSL